LNPAKPACHAENKVGKNWTETERGRGRWKTEDKENLRKV